MQRSTITSMRYHTRYHTFSFSLTWIGHNATPYHNFNVLLFFFFLNDGNTLQIAQNQANLRYKIW